MCLLVKYERLSTSYDACGNLDHTLQTCKWHDEHDPKEDVIFIKLDISMFTSISLLKKYQKQGL